MIVKARNTKAWELDVLGVPYGGPENGRDSDGQNFSKQTRLHEDKFPLPPVVYYHGMDEDGRSLGSPEYIGKTVGYEDRADGRWYHVILDETKDIARRVWDAAKNGIARASSGTAGHLARFADNGHIDEWPVVELSLFDAIGARQPANQYAVALPRLKALGIEPQTKGDTAKGAEASPEAKGAALNEVNNREVKQMSEQNDNTQAAPAFDMEAFGDIVGKAVKAQVEPISARLAKLEEEDARPVNDPGFAVKSKVEVVTDSADNQKPYKSAGEFYEEVIAAGNGRVTDRLLPLKSEISKEGIVYQLPGIASKGIKSATGLNELIPADGGFLVGSDRQDGVLMREHMTGQVWSRARNVEIGPNSNGMIFNAIDETSRATGSRWGGVTGYWLAEAAAKTASKPTFRQMEEKLKKLAALVYMTDELLQDSTALASVVNEVVPKELAWQKDDAAINGSGVGKPLGILNSPATVSIAKETGQAAATIVAENVINMWARRWGENHVWFVNRDTMPQLIQMNLAIGTGGALVYMPPGGLSGAPYGTLLGAPVIEIEQCQTLGTVGDIILADMSQYVTISKGGVARAESIHVRFVYDESVLRFVERVDGQPAWDSALTPANGTNTQSPFLTLATRA